MIGQSTLTTILPPASYTTTGGGADIDLKNVESIGKFVYTGLNTAGTNPTLDVKLQSSVAVVTGSSYTTEGATDNKLRDGANSNIKLSAQFTQSGARQIKYVYLQLKKFGTVASGNLTLTIETDSTGDPSGTALGTATISTDTVASTYGWAKFTFTNPVDVANTTVYHVVLAGAYTESSSNCIGWRSKTVASGGNFEFYDSAWSATATESLEYYAEEYNFSDITGGAFTQHATASSQTAEAINVDLNIQNRYVRAYRTIGGTSNPAFTSAVVLLGLNKLI